MQLVDRSKNEMMLLLSGTGADNRPVSNRQAGVLRNVERPWLGNLSIQLMALQRP